MRFGKNKKRNGGGVHPCGTSYRHCHYRHFGEYRFGEFE